MKKTLIPDEEILALVKSLGEAQATKREMAQYLTLSPAVLESAFKRHKILQETYDKAKISGLIALKKAQLKLAQTNATMAIWLGKQYLKQKDKHDISASEATPFILERIEHIIIDPQNDKNLKEDHHTTKISKEKST
ncbi:hypothetical protein [Bartonella tamiae]|uniref:Uncharacterized protein n=1 Tax=Bartonella tamiae Th239 TaxID=1094558 RepID=J1JVV5_9HYPH|nr:hypothetical protein [Bartonella tamiae]EJF89107.1 hypothetical protein ME5_01658 [Bartonella tamiae Th239]EJF95490.1 hypothetical protein MEG_00223 [Bartonella tamiae Th307]